MQISFKNIQIHPALKGHIGKLWVFESSGRIPDMDMKLVVPNGMVKLVIPFRNGFIGQRGSYSKSSAINQVTLAKLANRDLFLLTIAILRLPGAKIKILVICTFTINNFRNHDSGK